ncbi:flagellar basal body P-ring protein FlgI [Pseudoalteromonas sp. SMS1]|uniref:flagellar basal body P-ring protein FlgI n=1 Tax=Pseudoalteromonas sp. SMS1 TaxID=2908894 RepID=UPI001F40E317|nr:flagellar basal body P-ring protein FlgI [Pseudoalteromonas sp. SMS1]MCF2860218.1 flagellar basal body P-ring protein FlgI [Pseudoalteromonas sp. SMS1]
MKFLFIFTALLCLSQVGNIAQASQANVKIKDIARVDGVRDNALVGYGIVVGLAGTGDTSRNGATIQSIRNTLENFGLILDLEDIKARNVAAVIVSTDLPPFAQPGDRIDVHVSSLGDAKSLSGGTLFMTPLKGADDEIYALAQGVLAVGGYQFEANQSSVQKNHPTVGVIHQGAVVEREVKSNFLSDDGLLHLVLRKPDFIMADRVVQALQTSGVTAQALHAGKIQIVPPQDRSVISSIAQIQNLYVEPPAISRVVINERTGTLVAGADVQVGNVVISHGSLKLTIDTNFLTSQPNTMLGRPSNAIQTVVVPDSEIQVTENQEALYTNKNGTNISDLVDSLKAMKLSTRDIISILQALKQSGALHAELVVQ